MCRLVIIYNHRREVTDRVTTNYTWILNENLDQFEVESAEEEYEYSNGLGWHETADGLEWDQ